MFSLLHYHGLKYLLVMISYVISECSELWFTMVASLVLCVCVGIIVNFICQLKWYILEQMFDFRLILESSENRTHDSTASCSTSCLKPSESTSTTLDKSELPIPTLNGFRHEDKHKKLISKFLVHQPDPSRLETNPRSDAPLVSNKSYRCHQCGSMNNPDVISEPNSRPSVILERSRSLRCTHSELRHKYFSPDRSMATLKAVQIGKMNSIKIKPPQDQDKDRSEIRKADLSVDDQQEKPLNNNKTIQTDDITKENGIVTKQPTSNASDDTKEQHDPHHKENDSDCLVDCLYCAQQFCCECCIM